MADTKSFLRQWFILRELAASKSGWTLQELAAEHSASQKTIRRDFDALRQAGFQLQESTISHGQKVWKIRTDSVLQGLTFNFDEVIALYLGRRFLEPLANTSIWDGAQKAFRKIRAGLGQERIAFLEQLATAIHQTAIGASDYSQRSEVIDALMTCVESSSQTEIRYHSTRRGCERFATIYPYGFIYHKASLYLVAFAPEHGEIRHYKIDRISEATQLDTCFERPAEFDLDVHLQNTFGVYHSDKPPTKIRVRFSPEVADYIQEHRWHATQTTEIDSDGSVVVTLQLSEFEEVKAWVLSFGAKAVLEEPEELREAIFGEIDRMRNEYET